MTQLITSLHNPAVKNLLLLRQRRHRDRQQRFLIDGVRAVRLALRHAVTIERLYYVEALADRQTVLLQQARGCGVPLQPVSPQVFQRIGYGEHPEGILGVALQPRLSLDDFPRSPTPLYLVAERLEKPGNLGAILRAADAAGITGLIVCDLRLDVWNPNVIRASQGACFTVPIASASATIARCWLRRAATRILAAVPYAERLYWDESFRGPCALIVGAEHAGLTAVWQDAVSVGIPMVGAMDSLNVAQAATVLMFEAMRQRRSLGCREGAE